MSYFLEWANILKCTQQSLWFLSFVLFGVFFHWLLIFSGGFYCEQLHFKVFITCTSCVMPLAGLEVSSTHLTKMWHKHTSNLNTQQISHQCSSVLNTQLTCFSAYKVENHIFSSSVWIPGNKKNISSEKAGTCCTLLHIPVTLDVEKFETKRK